METALNLLILGIPQPKQSVRARAIQKGVKWIATPYKDPVVRKDEQNIRAQIINQLPDGFKPFEGPISIKASFRFPLPKSTPKKRKTPIEEGALLGYKTTKPDLNDNLMKGFADAMNGIVFTDDSQVCRLTTEKIYSRTPCIVAEIREIEQFVSCEYQIF
jgi:Holliday junction resolvase RusA-like endonuclease